MNSAKISSFFWVTLIYFVQVGLSYFFMEKTPPLVLIALIYYSLLRGPFFAFFLGVFSGCLMDVFASGLFGLSALLYGLTGILFGLLSSKFFRDSLLTQALSSCLGHYLVVIFTLMAASHFGESFDHSGLVFFKEAFFMSNPLVTAISSPFVFRFLEKRSSYQKERVRSWV